MEQRFISAHLRFCLSGLPVFFRVYLQWCFLAAAFADGKVEVDLTFKWVGVGGKGYFWGGILAPCKQRKKRKEKKRKALRVIFLFLAYCLRFGSREKWRREQIYFKTRRRNNTAMNTESQFGTQRWLTAKFRSFQACMGNSCARIKEWALLISWGLWFEKSLFMCGGADDYWDSSGCLGQGIRTA